MATETMNCNRVMIFLQS